MPAQILITGVPGQVGSEVAHALARAGAAYAIAAFAVDEAANAFPGADIRRFDFLDADTYERAFAGIDRLFLVRPPAISNVKRDIAPALRAARQAGVRHIVFLSLQGVERNRVTPHYKIEQLILQSGVSYTFLRASFFMQNLSTTHAAEIRDDGQIAVPVGRARTSFIDVRDIGAVAALALLNSEHEQQQYTLTGGEALDYFEVAAILSEVLGRPVRYTNPSPLAFIRRQQRAGRPLAMTLVMTALYTIMITRLGNASETTEDVQRLLGRPPITFRQFARDAAAVWQQAAIPAATP
jgi:uncharacterized protein YbjT (DUF2867 family)